MTMRIPDPIGLKALAKKRPRLTPEATAERAAGRVQQTADEAWRAQMEQRRALFERERLRDLIARADELMTRIEDRIEAGAGPASEHLANQVETLAREAAVSIPHPAESPVMAIELLDQLFDVQAQLLRRRTGDGDREQREFDQRVDRRGRPKSRGRRLSLNRLHREAWAAG